LPRLGTLVLDPGHERKLAGRLHLRQRSFSGEYLGRDLSRRPGLEEPAELGVAPEIRLTLAGRNLDILSLKHDLVFIVDRRVDDVDFA